MTNPSALAADRDHAMPAQDVAGRGAAGQAPARMALVQQRQQLLAAPGRVSAPRLQDRGHDLVRRLVGRPSRSARALLQPGWPLAQVPVDPFVAGLSGDPVQRAQLGDRELLAQVIGDELRPLVHR
jgi:hypothetical protein